MKFSQIVHNINKIMLKENKYIYITIFHYGCHCYRPKLILLFLRLFL